MSDGEVRLDDLPDEVEELEDPVIVEREELMHLHALAETAEQLERLNEMLEDQ